jgi:hypothetical protein
VAAALTTLAQEAGLPATWETAITKTDATRIVPPARPTRRMPIIRRRRHAPWLLITGGVCLAVVLAGAAVFLALANRGQQPAFTAASSPAWAKGVKGGDVITGIDKNINPPASLSPRLILQCGKAGGQDELVLPGLGYTLLQGQTWDKWPATAAKPHCWFHPTELRFELRLPAGSPAKLRFHFVDGDERQRRQRLIVQGRTIGDFADFAGAGKLVEVNLTSQDTRTSRIEVAIQNLNPTAPNAVVSTIELLTP